MGYEKKYKDLVKAVKELQEANPSDKRIQNWVNENVPELAESEDERIVENIISWLKNIDGQTIPINDYNAALTWLKNLKERVQSQLQWKPSEKHKFNIGDIISNGQAVYRVDDITKDCIGRDCYFLVHVESEKNGLRYLLSFTDSEGKHSNFGEITLLCEQVDKSFEKQGEQKPADRVEPRFKVGEWVVQENIGIFKVIEICESWYEVVDGEDDRYSISFDKEYMCRLWDITKDAKEGDVLVDVYGNIGIFEKRYGINWHTYCYLGNEGRLVPESGSHGSICYPASKEQRDLLFQKMKEAGYKWDAENKQLRKIESRQEELTEFEKSVKQVMEEFIECGDIHNLKADADMLLRLAQKTAWSEEDEYNFAFIQEALLGLDGDDSYREKCCKMAEWLTSFRPQKQWKPSDEQIKVCKEVYADLLSAKGFDVGTINSELNRLEEQLKKLREE